MVHDLEELILKCRDERAKAYIREAVGCYGAGSYRSCIVATWIAVAFDIIDKIKELALAGDREAEKLSAELEGIRRRSDVVQALNFERRLLDIAKNNFELISPVEYEDLKRISEDRNRCAHPSQTSDTDIFSPPAELARLHMRSAVEILLAHQPAQGKAALEGIVKTIESEYFPADRKKALAILSSGPLKRARHSLVRNLVLILTKSILSSDTDFDVRRRYEVALGATHSLHPEAYLETLRRELTRLVQQVPDEHLKRVCGFVADDEGIWDCLDNGSQIRVRTFVEQLPGDDLDELETLIYSEQLSDAATTRARRATLKEIERAMFFSMPSALIDRLIDLYERSENFDQANAIGKVIRSNSSDLQKAHVERIVKAASKNGQISGSFQFSDLINAVRQNKKVPDLDAILKANGLK